MLPKSTIGAPGGPGATPAVAPGAGAGNEAAASAMVNAAMPALHKALAAFPLGSEKYKAVHSAIKALFPVFGSPEEKSLVPAAISQMATANRAGGPLASAPAPGLTPAPAPSPGGAAAAA